MNKITALQFPSRRTRKSTNRLFKHLCQSTVPHGFENAYYGPMLERYGCKRDSYGNWFVTQGKRPTTAFMAHMDTASHLVNRVTFAENGGVVRSLGDTILGADDRAGMTVLLSLLDRKIPGLYCFFVGEESGCIGSKQSAKHNWQRYGSILNAVAFDRRGKSDIITHQTFSRCCSDDFALALSSELNMKHKPDDGGTFTDTNSFVDLIPECTNIAVGYQNAHSTKEFQDINYLKQLIEAAATVRWNKLPVKRIAGSYDPKPHCYNQAYAWDYWGESWWEPKTQTKPKIAAPTYDNFHWDALMFAVRNGGRISDLDLYVCLSEDQNFAFDLIAEYRKLWGSEIWDKVYKRLELT